MQGKKHKGVSWYQFCDGLSKRSVICNTFCDLHLGATCTSVTAGPIPPNQPPASLDLASMAITKTWRMAILGIAPPFLLLFLSTSRGLYQMLCRLALACAHRTHYLWVGCGSSIRHRIWHTLTCIYADSVCAFCMHELVCVCSMLCHRSAGRHVCLYAYMYLYT